MLSKAQNKYIRSLSQQKYRKEHNAFVAEGDKIVREWLGSDAQIQHIVALQDWAIQYDSEIARHPEAELHIVAPHELEQLSELQTPNQALIVAQIPDKEILPPIDGWCLAVDNLQDPGNMGTIIRIADWFGIKTVVCSHNSVDVYNPKVVQAAMGGHLRVSIYKTDLAAFLETTTLPVLAAVLGGENIYKMEKPKEGVIVIGNESKGLSQGIVALATHKVTIPKQGGAESLNAAVSAGILCALLAGC